MQALTNEQLFSGALQQLQAGRLKNAEQLYREILRVEPTSCNALHMLGVTLGLMGEHQAAAETIQNAIDHRPDFPEAHYNLANCLRDSGHAEEAIVAFRTAILQRPAYSKAYLNLCALLIAIGRLDEAIIVQRQATVIDPFSPDAYYNLGKALKEKGDLNAAVDAYQHATTLRPKYAEAFHNMGNALGLAGRFDEAIEAFRRTIQINHKHTDAYSGLSAVLRFQGRFDEALEVCRRAIALLPDAPQAHCESGNVLKEMGMLYPAKAAFLDALTRDPNHVMAFIGLAQTLEDLDDLPGAITALETARALVLDPSSFDFVLASLGTAKVPETAPAPFVAGLFDEYAGRFDSHLKRLDYVGPQLLFDAVTAVRPTQPLDTIDLGCGTGLCGMLFRSIARQLTGVDLSSRMIEQARQRKIYDHLEQQDIVAALQQHVSSFDLILAADVFIYVGALEAVFSAAAAALRKRGLFAFTVESLEVGEYELRNSRRYAQSVDYIRRLCATTGFRIISIQGATIRTDHDKPVPANVFVLSID